MIKKFKIPYIDEKSTFDDTHLSNNPTNLAILFFTFICENSESTSPGIMHLSL